MLHSRNRYKFFCGPVKIFISKNSTCKTGKSISYFFAAYWNKPHKTPQKTIYIYTYISPNVNIKCTVFLILDVVNAFPPEVAAVVPPPAVVLRKD